MNPPHVISSARLDLVLLTPEMISLLLSGEPESAGRLGGFCVPAGWPDEHDASFLRLRVRQMENDPATTGWFVRAMVLREDTRRSMVGHIGFHGPPRKDGSLEMGYTVFPKWRRRGYAMEAAEGLMAWAGSESGAKRFVLSISPENTPSLAMAEKMGFTRIGEQWDEEDGLEWVFERLS